MDLTLNDFAVLFGIPTEEMPDECRQLIERHNFRYRTLTGDERQQTLSGVLERIDAGEFSVAGPEGKDRWDVGWGENLKEFQDSEHDVAALGPKYFRDGMPLRLNQEYIVPEDQYFEKNWYDVFRLWIFKKYLSGYAAIYEFGCGSGFNLSVLSDLYPDTKLHGLDWAQASKQIVDEMRTVKGMNTWGHVFDFFKPDRSVVIPTNSAIITVGALEQTGHNYLEFLQYVLDSDPALVLHIEPIIDWYDSANPIDEAAIRFHQKRNYWQGYVDRLKALESSGDIRIIKMKRSFFGSFYIEGFSQLIWEPVAK